VPFTATLNVKPTSQSRYESLICLYSLQA